MSASLPQQWLEKANEDLAVARLLRAEVHFSHTCLLSQQCVEKSLKAYLIHRSNTHPRIHNLVDLLEQCSIYHTGFDQFVKQCEEIDDYYTSTRYPTGGAVAAPTEAEADRAIKGAEDILKFVEQQIGTTAP